MAKRPQWMGRDAREKNKKKKTGIIKKEKKRRTQREMGARIN
jgi:hypothetical protein